jgi:hypothetical protein
MSSERSVWVPTAFGNGCQKLGQPVPLSYLVSDENNGNSHPAQEKTPFRFSPFNGELPGRSVPCSRKTRYCAGLSCRFHSSTVFSTSNVFASAVVAPSFKARQPKKAAAAAANAVKIVLRFCMALSIGLADDYSGFRT